MELEKFLHLPVRDRTIINDEHWKAYEITRVLTRDPRVTENRALAVFTIQAVAISPESRILWYLREEKGVVYRGLMFMEDILGYRPLQKL